MQPKYAEVAQILLDFCREYRGNQVTLEDFKNAVWSAAADLSSPEERDLRDFLQKSEGELDMVQFTVNEADIYQESLEVINVIEAALLAYLAGGDTQLLGSDPEIDTS